MPGWSRRTKLIGLIARRLARGLAANWALVASILIVATWPLMLSSPQPTATSAPGESPPLLPVARIQPATDDAEAPPDLIEAGEPAASAAPALDPSHDWPGLVANRIRETGRACVIVHVALADRRLSRVPRRLGDGRTPETNMFWGAKYGVETFLMRQGGWQRLHVDDGGPAGVRRRIVLGREVTPTAEWRARGITSPFQVLLLAVAWSSDHIEAAMTAPLRDALSPEGLTVPIEGVVIDFARERVMTGYLGQNRMVGRVWNPLHGLPDAADAPCGVFYIASQSAAFLHEAVVERGLYPVLFTRAPIVAEAYVLDGVLAALASGALDGGFVDAAARAYGARQKLSATAARKLFRQ